jgi:hypothetical protein
VRGPAGAVRYKAHGLQKENIVTYADYNQLRRSVGLDPNRVGAALGIDDATLASWNDEKQGDRKFSEEETNAIRTFFLRDCIEECSEEVAKAIRSFFLTDLIEECCEQAFDDVPSEAVAIWLVVERRDRELRRPPDRDCLLLPKASRIHDLEQDKRKAEPNVRFETPLDNRSLTTYPFESRRPLNLAGDAITEHVAKKHKQNRANFIFRDGVCESILHVPAFVGKDPCPLLLLSFENKLDKQRRVIVPRRGETRVYTNEDDYKDVPEDKRVEPDENKAIRLAKEFGEQLLPLMKDLGMIKIPDQS